MILNFSSIALGVLVLSSTLATQASSGNQFEVAATGEGKVEARPDIAIIAGSLVLQGATNTDLLSQADIIMERVLAALRKQSISANDIQAGQVRIQQIWDHHKGQRESRGYEAKRPIQVTVRKIDRYPLIIDTLSTAGINTLSNVSFDFSKRQKLEDDAIKAAAADAIHKSKLLGKSLGGDVCQPKQISLGQRHVPMPRLEMAMMAKSASKDAYNPGKQTITATVNTVFACKPSTD